MAGSVRRRRTGGDHGRRRRLVRLAPDVVPRERLPLPVPTSSEWPRSFQNHQSCNSRKFRFPSATENSRCLLYRPSKERHLCLSQKVPSGISSYQGGAKTRASPTTCLFSGCISARPHKVYEMKAYTKSPLTRSKRLWNNLWCSSACCEPSLFHFANLGSICALVLTR